MHKLTNYKKPLAFTKHKLVNTNLFQVLQLEVICGLTVDYPAVNLLCVRLNNRFLRTITREQ